MRHNYVTTLLTLFFLILSQFAIGKGMKAELVEVQARPIEGAFIEINWVNIIPPHLEVEYSYYEIERSLNGLSFSTLATLSHSDAVDEYRYEDSFNLKENVDIYYRIKVVDTDGLITFSHLAVTQIEFAREGLKNVYPNPISSMTDMNLTFFNVSDTPYGIKVVDYMGRIVFRASDLQPTFGKQTVSVPIGNWMPGIYTILYHTEGIREGKKILIY